MFERIKRKNKQRFVVASKMGNDVKITLISANTVKASSCFKSPRITCHNSSQITLFKSNDNRKMLRKSLITLYKKNTRRHAAISPVTPHKKLESDNRPSLSLEQFLQSLKLYKNITSDTLTDIVPRITRFFLLTLLLGHVFPSFL